MLEITDNVSLKVKVIGENYVVARVSKLLSKCKISNGRKCLNLKNMTLHNITDELCMMLFKLLHEQNLLRDTKVLDLLSNKLSAIGATTLVKILQLCCFDKILTSSNEILAEFRDLMHKAYHSDVRTYNDKTTYTDYDKQ